MTARKKLTVSILVIVILFGLFLLIRPETEVTVKHQFKCRDAKVILIKITTKGA